MKIQDAIKQAKQNDQKAFNYLLDRFWDSVYGFQLKRVENENDAEISPFKPFLKLLIKLILLMSPIILKPG